MPGFVIKEPSGVIDLVKKILSDELPQNYSKIDQYFTWHDKNNTDRAVEKLLAMEKQFNVHKLSFLFRKILYIEALTYNTCFC